MCVCLLLLAKFLSFSSADVDYKRGKLVVNLMRVARRTVQLR